MAQEKMKPSLSEIQRSYFSQLRTLCRTVERGIEELKQESCTNQSTSSEDSVNARNMILHTTKELKDLKGQAQAQYREFVIHGARFSRIQELMQDLFKVYWERIEAVELFIEKYGYERPRNENFDKLSSKIPEEVNNLLLTPEKNESGDSTAEKLSHASALKTPETPAFLSAVNRSRRMDHKVFQSNVTEEKNSTINTSHTRPTKNVIKAPLLSTPETPEHIRAILIGSVTKIVPEATQGDFSLPSTPEQVRNVVGSTTKSKPDADSLVFAALSNPTPETPENIRTIINSIKKPKQDTKLGFPAPFSTPETPETIRTVMSSVKKPKPNPESVIPGPFSTPETPDNIRTIIGSMKKSKPSIAESAGPQFPKENNTTRHAFEKQDVFTANPPKVVPLESDLIAPETPENVRRILSQINNGVAVHERGFPEQPKALQAFEQQHELNCQVPKSRPTVRRNILPNS